MAKQQSSSDASNCLKCGGLTKLKLLSCLHWVCECAITNELHHKGEVTCPHCGEVTDVEARSLDDLPTAFHVMGKIAASAEECSEAKRKCRQCDRKTPIRYCNDCGPICSHCVVSHEFMVAFKSHEVSEEGQSKKLAKPKCKRHNKQLKYYCTESGCGKVFCKLCTCYGIPRHRESMKAVEQMEYNDLKRSVQKLAEGGSILQGKADALKVLIEDVREEGRGADEEVDRLCNKLTESLEQHRSNLKKKAAETLSRKVDALEKQEQELNQLLGNIRHTGAVVTECLESDNPVSKASCFRFFSNSVQNNFNKLEKISTTPCTIKDIRVEQRGGFPQFLEGYLDVASHADPSQCTVDAAAVSCGIVGETKEIVIQTVYGNGQPCMEEQRVEARIVPGHHLCSEDVPSAISLETNSTYILKYKAENRGKYTLTITVNGEDIAGSPFELIMFIDPRAPITPGNCKRINNLNQPYQVAFTSKNEMFVTQKGDNSIKRFHVDSHQRNTFDFRQDRSSKPTGIAIDERDNVYISFENKGNIVKVDKNGEWCCETGDLHRPGRLFYDRTTRNLFVCERGKDRIRVYNSSDLNEVDKLANGIRCSSVVCDGDGTTYVTDKNGCNIHKFTKDDKRGGSLLFSKGVLSAPRGVCLQNGCMFIADRDHSRVVIAKDYSSPKPDIVNEVEVQADAGSIISDVHGSIYICNERYNYILVL